MSFESPDNEKNFPGLYKAGVVPDQLSVTEDDHEKQSKKKELGLGKKKDGRKDKKEKGYTQFEEEESEEEIASVDDIKSPSKSKKSKPGFKFPARKDIFVKKEKHIPEEKKDKEKKEEKDKKKEEKDGKKYKLKDRKKGKHGRNLQEPTEEEASAIASPIFGIPLAQAVERNRCHDGIELPAIFRECVDYIEEYGLSCEGIYRISGVKSKVQNLKDCYNRGTVAYLEEHEPNVVASLLKQFLRELPEPVLTTAAMSKFEEASTIKNNKKRIEQFRKLIDDLPTCNRLLLSWMIVHMTHIIQKQKENKMTLQNVSIVLSPTMQISHRVLNILFTHTHQIFSEDVIKRYVPPLKPATSRWSLELPDAPAALEEELGKQESLLNQLHEELNAGVKDPMKEEQLWEVQRVVTQLKRKIKFAKKAADVAEKRRKDIESKKSSASLSDVEELQLNLREIPKTKKPESEKRPTGETLQPDQQKTTRLKDLALAKETKRYKAPAPPGVDKRVSDHEIVKTVDIEVDKKDAVVDVEVQSSGQDDVELEPGEERLKDEEVGTKEQAGCEESKEMMSASENDEQIPEEEISVEDKVPELEQEENKSESQEDKNVDSQEEKESQKEGNKSESQQEGEKNELNISESKEEEKKSISQQLETKSDSQQDEKTSQKEAELEKTRVQQDNEETKMAEQEVEESQNAASKEVPVHPHVHLTSELLQPIKAESVTPKKEETVEVSVRKSEELRELEEELLGEQKTEKRKVKFSEVSKQTGEVKSDRNTAFTVQADVHIDGQEEVVWEADDEETQALMDECEAQKMEEEELLAIADELRQKIETEEDEIERLHQEITELQYLRQDSDLEDMSSSSDSSDESEDEEELQDILLTLKQENEILEKQNSELCQKIHEERMICLAVKLEIRLLQQRQLETSTGSNSGTDRETFL